MDFTVEGLASSGFTGFVRIGDMQRGGIRTVPRSPGVYVVLRTSLDTPSFLDYCPVPMHDDRPLAYPRDTLVRDWIVNCSVVYIGKSTDLRKRLGQYMDFGLGRPRPHRGGRSIWQLADSSELIVAWKPLPADDRPDRVESTMLSEFKRVYGHRPFANKRD